MASVPQVDDRPSRADVRVELAEREARVLAQLQHPLLPAFIDNFEEDGALYLAMEKIEGPSLRALAARIGEALAAVHVHVDDESHLHAGHVGARDGGGHFRATIVSGRFEGLSRVARQRLVFEAVSEQMKGEVHALAMKTFTPGRPSFHTSGALRGITWPSASARWKASPLPPSPIGRGRSSLDPASGWWQVAQEMFLLPLRILSKNRSRPNSTFAARGFPCS